MSGENNKNPATQEQLEQIIQIGTNALNKAVIDFGLDEESSKYFILWETSNPSWRHNFDSFLSKFVHDYIKDMVRDCRRKKEEGRKTKSNEKVHKMEEPHEFPLSSRDD